MGVANGYTLDKASIMMKRPMKIVDFFNLFFPFFFLFGKLIKRFIEMIGLLFSGPPMPQIATEISLLMTGRKSTNPYKAAAALKPFYELERTMLLEKLLEAKGSNMILAIHMNSFAVEDPTNSKKVGLILRRGERSVDIELCNNLLLEL